MSALTKLAHGVAKGWASSTDVLACQGRRRVHQVISHTDWVFYWIARYLAQSLSRDLGVASRVTHNPWAARNQILHFGDRFLCLFGPRERLHPSNVLLMTWYHGDDRTGDPEIVRLLAALEQALPDLHRVVVSCSISRGVLERYGVPAAQIEQIPLGVDLEAFQPPAEGARDALRRALGIPPEAFCVGSFQKDGLGGGAGLEPKPGKGPDVFLRVVERLHAEHPHLWVLLTGPGRGYVKQGLAALGVPFVHRVLDHYLDVVPCYQALDLYVIGSRVEGGPMALAESWATGVPVVSTRVGMPADLIRHGENGLMADIDDVDALREAAVQLLADDTLRQAVRAQALHDVAALGWTPIAARHLERLYAPLLAETGR